MLKVNNIPFEEEIIELNTPNTFDDIAKVTGSDFVPVLLDDGFKIWDSLAIIEYLNEKFPDAIMWPIDPKARAHARAISHEMHSGFVNLRLNCPLLFRKVYHPKPYPDEVLRDVKRICDLWEEAISTYGQGGKFLYGEFSIADAMYAPVVSRFHTYSHQVSDIAKDYMHTIRSMPEYQEWEQAAIHEPYCIKPGETDEGLKINYQTGFGL